jgi:hypothetical protein
MRHQAHAHRVPRAKALNIKQSPQLSERAALLSGGNLTTEWQPLSLHLVPSEYLYIASVVSKQSACTAAGARRPCTQHYQPTKQRVCVCCAQAISTIQLPAMWVSVLHQCSMVSTRTGVLLHCTRSGPTDQLM